MEKISKPKIKFIAFLLVLCCVVYSNTALAAGLFLSPSKGEHAPAEGFKVTVYTSSSDLAINAVSGVVHFPPDILNVVSLSKAGSIISNWVTEPSFSNSAGTVNFEGIILNPGYTGSSGNIVTINFKGIAPGNANLSISGGSVLANDGQGTEVFSGSSGANFTISAPKPADPATPTPTPETPAVVPGGIKVVSSSHVSPEAWYTAPDINLSWDRPNNVYGYSFILDQNPNTEPDSVLETTVTTNKSYLGVKDGVWYFHIKGRPRASSASFGPTTHYKIQIDSMPPKDFELKIADSTVTFQTTDEVSGVDHFQALVDGQIVSENVSSPYTFTDLSNGLRSLQIIAFDKANNKTESLISVNIYKEVPRSFWTETVTIPWYLLLLMNLLILILLVIIVWLLLLQKRYSRNNKNNTIQELQSDIDLTLEKLRNEISSRLLKLNANSIDELVQKETKIAKSINSDIKKSKVLIDKKITKASKKK